MALPVFRWGCCRFPSLLGRFGPGRGPLSRTGCPRVLSATSPRTYTSHRGGQERQKVVVVGIPNPFIWFRTRIYFFLIRTYFDKEFSVEEFTEGATQAFSHVSKLLSQCHVQALDGLVAKDLVGKLEEKLAHLSPNHKKALCAEPGDIMFTTTGDVSIYYDDGGELGFLRNCYVVTEPAVEGGIACRKFVSILMRFWYLTSSRLPDESMEGARIFQVSIGGEGEAQAKRLLTANYEFQREFTQGVLPDWTITRIEHSKLLD
ncbi:m-AAA protease-interacting protein 1, mitochondrial isoform X1 [Denticeps clupeoides]|uniref:m-AAA protease-interacting protein 1, mitochondrial isoform X1 n=1 Tax=Denticeps clupeoides TaxID=299321 RepID=UPI0010A4D0EB|nr:m-AAA protease-interacting protein 1, mitochondrial isoform X1 [Denticeps clupeoides]